MREASTKSNRGPYLWLAVLFYFVVVSQTTFTVDVIRDLTGNYAATPVWLRDPWPTIDSVWYGQKLGLQAGDRVIAADGRPLIGRKDYASIIRAKHPGDPLTLTTEHDGQVSDHRIVLGGLFRPHASTFMWFFGTVSWLLLPWLCILLGFWVAAMRPRDVRAWLTLGILVGLSQVNRPEVLDPAGWPAWIGVPSASFRSLAALGWAVCMMWFGLIFPEPGRLEKRVPWLKWVLTVPLCAIAISEALHVAGRCINSAATKRWLPEIPLPDLVITLLMMCSISIFFAGIGEKYSNDALGQDDRRRLKLLYWGCTVACTPMFLLFLYTTIFLHRGPGDSDGYWLAFGTMVEVLFPITMAYVIVVQRALDVRVVIRQGVQYALARRGIVVLQILVTSGVVILAVSLAGGANVNRPLRILAMAVGINVVFLIRYQAERLGRWLDRRFFREAYNAEQILGELSEQVRSILDRDALLETVVRRISESLHVDRIAVMLQQGGMFRPALAMGYPAEPQVAFAYDYAVVNELRRTHEPVAVDAASPEQLQRLNAELLLPLASKKELLGFISLGPKKSEEPYSSSDTRLLRTVAAQTGMALENSRLTEAIASEMAQRELLHREIEIAREVQERLFPQNMPEVAALEYAGHCRPARGVGGDYYDFLALSSGRLGLAIGDVSGKGVPAALLMASLQASVRGQSQTGSSDVAGLMTNVNLLVCDASPENRYATFFYAQFEPFARKLTYTNGGHNPPILLRGSQVIRLENGGPPVGLFRLSRYEQEEILLEAGDLLILYTDGVSEAENSGEEEWGEDALIATVRGCAQELPAEIIQRIMQAADAFAAGAPQHDDMTLVIARVLPV